MIWRIFSSLFQKKEKCHRDHSTVLEKVDLASFASELRPHFVIQTEKEKPLDLTKTSHISL